MDTEITYLKNDNIDEAIRQKLRKKDEYETDKHKIYNIIVGHTNEVPQEKAASDATFQTVKTSWYPIEYLKILEKLWFSNQSKQHPIQSLFLATNQLSN